MRSAAFLFVLVLATAANSVAQRPRELAEAPPPPPAPASVKPWESADGGFKVYFPGKPTTKTTETDSSFGKTSLTEVSLGTSMAYFSVTYLDFPTAITDRYDLDSRFDLMRDGQAKRLSARVTEDSQLSFGGYYGRSNVFETEKETISSRVFVVGPRLFMLFVVNRGRMSTAPQTVASAAKRRIENFFNSFEVTRIPEAKTQIVRLPADFSVAATSTSFHSRFFGVSFTPPKGWNIVDKDLTNLTMELGKQEMERTNPRLAAQLTDQNTRVLAMYSRKPLEEAVSDGVLFVIAEQAPYPNFLAESLARTYEKLHLESSEKVTKPVTLSRIGGQQFAWVETFDNETKMYTRAYFANVKGIAFEIIYGFRAQTDVAEFNTVLGTLKFEEVAAK